MTMPDFSLYSQEIQKFIAFEINKAEQAKIGINLQNTPKVQYFGRSCNGFFEANWSSSKEQNGPHLSTAVGKPLEQWLPIFVHESSHMDQFLENSPYWMNTVDYSVLDDWLDGKDYSKEEITKTIHNVIMMEADCEIRTIEKIKLFNLPIDISYYATRANAYLNFHHYMLENRVWYKVAPYEVHDILLLMSKKMSSLDSYLSRPSDKIMSEMPKCI